MQSKFILAFTVFALLIAGVTYATAQTVRRSGSNVQIYDGGAWRTMNSATLGVCSTPGQMRYNAGAARLEYCGSTNWISMDSGKNAGSCSSSQAGTIRYSSNTLQFCNGTNWRNGYTAPINGSCNSVHYNCNAGTSNSGAVADTGSQWRWRCDGQYGGSNSGTCTQNKPINGSCNATHYNCNSGTSNSGAVADTGSQWRWRCDGQYGGSNSGTCTENKTVPVNGACGSAAGQEYSSSTPPSGSSLCNAGTASSVNSNYAWTCNGIDGGSNASCCAHKLGNSLSVTVTGGNRSCTNPTVVWSGNGNDTYCFNTATPFIQAYPASEFCYRRHVDSSCIVTLGRSTPSGCSGCGTANIDKNPVNSCAM